MKKYELTDETMEYGNHTLHRIKALVTIPGVVEAGDLGGWVESEENLSHDGDCWVYENAVVSGNAEVSENAKVCANACVCGSAVVFGKAKVLGNTMVHGDAEVCGNAKVYENAMVYDSAKVHGSASVFENAMVYDRAMVHGNAEIYGDAAVSGDAEVCQYAKVYGRTMVFDGHITDRYDCITVGPVGSRGDFTTFNKTTGMVCTGCFKGTLGTFEAAVRETHGDNEHGSAYNSLIAYFKTLIDPSCR